MECSSEKCICDTLRGLGKVNEELEVDKYLDVYGIRELMAKYFDLPEKPERPGPSSFKQRVRKTLYTTVVGESNDVVYRFREDETIGKFPGGIEAEWKDMPIKADNCESLSFGYGGDVAPIDTPITEIMRIRNTLSKRVYCQISDVKPNVSRYECTCDKKSFYIEAYESATITLTLRLFCTIELDLKVPIRVWDGESDFCFMSWMKGSVFGEPSVKLDPNELEIGDELGRGTFGIVYSGEYRGSAVATKVLNDKNFRCDEDAKDAFDREVFNMEKLRHPAIVHFFGYVQQEGMLAIVTELCKYGSLDVVLKKRPQLSMMFRLKALLDVASAMNYLHCNHFIHRDLKPQNVLVSSLQPGKHPDTMSPIVKLADFGTTRGLGALALARKQMLMTADQGTPLFKAPEILNHSRYYSFPVDAFSFGILMPYVITGLIPYLQPRKKFAKQEEFPIGVVRGTLRPDIPEGISKDLEELMVCCWDGNPEHRPSFNEIVDTLLDVIDQEAAK